MLKVNKHQNKSIFCTLKDGSKAGNDVVVDVVVVLLGVVKLSLVYFGGLRVDGIRGINLNLKILKIQLSNSYFFLNFTYSFS